MKKYLLILILSITMCIGISSVEAASAGTISIVNGPAVRADFYGVNMIIARQQMKIVKESGEIEIYDAFCADMELFSYSGTKYIAKGNTVSNNTINLMLEWYYEQPQRTLEEYAIMQIRIWEQLGQIPDEIKTDINILKNDSVAATLAWVFVAKINGSEVDLSNANDPNFKTVYSTYVSMNQSIELKISSSPNVKPVYVYETSADLQDFYVPEIGKECEEGDEDCNLGPGTPGYVCNPEPTITFNACGTGPSTFIDPDWSCLVGNSEYLAEEQNEYATSNKICTVYCREEVTTNFPNNNEIFEAGQFFQVGTGGYLVTSWGPVSINGTRECRTYYNDGSGYKQGLNDEVAKSKLDSANKDVNSTYETYRIRHGYVNAVATPTGRDSGVIKSYKDVPYSLPAKYNWETEKYECPVKGILNGRKCEGSDQVADTYYPLYKKTNIHTGDVVEYAYGYSGEDQYDSYATEKKAYDDAVTALEQVIEAINFCTGGTVNYDLNPSVSFNYSGDSNYSYSGVLTNANQDGGKPGLITGDGVTSDNFAIYNCDTTSFPKNCTTIDTTFNNFKDHTYNEVVIKKENVYKNDEGYRYIGKELGTLFKSEPSNEQFIDLGFNVIPISPTRNPASYPISLTYGNVGHNGRFDTYETPPAYDCQYTVTNELTGKECEYGPGMAPEDCNVPGENMGGIDVIYRPIDLYNPFPAEDGLNRNTGANWCATRDCSYNNAVVQDVVLDNRNVTSDEVYNLTPLYTITLTPEIIQSIRQYNDSLDGNYGDFNLTCDANGRNCKSEFIHTSQFSNLIEGTCSTWSNDFEACRF